MNFELKTLSKAAIPEALEKVDRYRLLNEPREAESICMDILETEPDNQHALIALLLSITDQFGDGVTGGVDRSRKIIDALKSKYDRAYYSGIICERQAKAMLKQGIPGSGHAAYEWFIEAMHHFDAAHDLRPPDNEDAHLRWNTCARIIMTEKLKGRPEEDIRHYLE